MSELTTTTETKVDSIADIVDFEMPDGIDVTDVKPEPEAVPEAKPAAEVKPALEVEPKPTPSEVKPVEVKPAEAKPAEVKPTEAASPTSLQLRSNIEKELEAYFDGAVDQKDWELLEVEPRKIIPKLLAKHALWAYEALYHVFGNQIPSVVRTTLKQDSTISERETAFYNAWPELKKATGEDAKTAEQLMQIGLFWRKQNPNATAEQAIEGIGRTAMGMLGLVRAAAPVAKPTAVLPKVPARATGSPATQAAPAANPFADLAMWEPPEEE